MPVLLYLRQKRTADRLPVLLQPQRESGLLAPFQHSPGTQGFIGRQPSQPQGLQGQIANGVAQTQIQVIKTIKQIIKHYY
jgi:hypothetical protein